MVNRPAAPWVIERLNRRHNRAPFACGSALLDDWLKLRAGQFEKKGLARTYVAARPGENAVLGYYALSAHRVGYEVLPDDQAKGLPALGVPVVLLGRLAVDQTVRGQGLGSFLLMDALRRAQYLDEHVGIRAVEVDALDEEARRFYLKFGFVSLLDDPQHLFLPMQVIRKLGLPPLGESQG